VSTTTSKSRGVSGDPLDNQELAAWRGFLRVHSVLMKELDSELMGEHGLSLSSYEVLLFLADQPGGRLRMSELADSVLLSRSGLSRLIDRLERAGLVRREADTTDARGLHAVITKDGRRAFARARVTHLAGVRERFLGHLSESERQSLGELWDRLRPGAAGEPTC
jgi:DNA-binding MarR family transcriptional regulator